jgi:DNA-binding NtrC family response regulator
MVKRSERMANVLLVEDDANFLQALETMLVLQGHQVRMEVEQRRSMMRHCMFQTLS